MDPQDGRTRPGEALVPPPEIRQLRDLTHYRTEVIRERTCEAQRPEKLLEDAGIKLSAVVSCLLGKSARAMPEALIAGERDPLVPAEMAKAGMRAEREIPAQALTGRFTDHHAFLARTLLDRIDAVTATEARLSEEIIRQLAPFHRQVEPLTTIPGVSTRSAEVILAEIGVDVARFPSAAHLSWAGVCPGNHESAGKHTSGRSRPGDPWLKGALGLTATAAARSKNTYLAARYQRIAVRRGKKRAPVAVGHTILTSIRHMLTHDAEYHDLGGDYFIQRTGRARQTRRLVSRLNLLGHHVSLQAAEAVGPAGMVDFRIRLHRPRTPWRLREVRSTLRPPGSAPNS